MAVTEFVRASRLYDAQAGERVQWDWATMQPLAVSQQRVERAAETVEIGGDGK